MLYRLRNIWKKLKVFADGHNAPLSSVFLRSLYLYFRHDINLDDQIFNQALNPHIPLAEASQFVGNREFAKFQREVNSPYTQMIADKTLFAHLAGSFDFPHPDTFLYFEHSKDYSMSYGLTSDYQVLSTKSQWLSYLDSTLPEKFIIKSSHGMQGQGVEAFTRSNNGTYRGKTRQFTTEQIYEKVAELHAFGQCIFQEYLECHSAIAELTGSQAVQTVRLVTAKNEIGEISLYCALLKMVGNPDTLVDNFHGGHDGNMMANLNLKDGTIETATGFDETTFTHTFPTYHPRTNKKLTGFKVPFWHELTDCAVELHTRLPRVRIIGWDIAVTDQGPVILEGNPECGDMSPSRPWMTRKDMDHLKSLLFTPKRHRFPSRMHAMASEGLR